MTQIGHFVSAAASCDLYIWKRTWRIYAVFLSGSAIEKYAFSLNYRIRNLSKICIHSFFSFINICILIQAFWTFLSKFLLNIEIEKIEFIILSILILIRFLLGSAVDDISQSKFRWNILSVFRLKVSATALERAC